MTPRVMWRRRSLYEGAHKVETDDGTPVGDGASTQDKTAPRKVLHEAAHKVGAYEPTHAVRKPARVFESERDVIAQASKAALALGALGVVFGDIGTSPLYTEQVIFTQHRSAVHATAAGVYGIASLIFWALVILVCVKYAGFIMRAHNRGDGGILALTALIRRCSLKRGALFVTLGIFGASLFLGDGMITPAISVLSAVGGLKVATPGLSPVIVPISLAILLSLFVVQRWGTGAVGAMFGPVMLFWFGVLGVLGIHEVVLHP